MSESASAIESESENDHGRLRNSPPRHVLAGHRCTVEAHRRDHPAQERNTFTKLTVRIVRTELTHRRRFRMDGSRCMSMIMTMIGLVIMILMTVTMTMTVSMFMVIMVIMFMVVMVMAM